MNEPHEIELKLELDPATARSAIKQLPHMLGVEPHATKRLQSAYFDTRKHGLRRRGLTLRLRHDGETVVQTLKADRGLGIFDRVEWETSLRGDAPDADAFDETEPREILNARGTLRPLFVVEVDRTIWLVTEGVSAIEVALDIGGIFGGGEQVSIAEIELELRQGRASDLFALARRLGHLSDLRLGVRAKSDRGYALLDGASSEVAKAEPVALRVGMSAAEAFQAIARSCLRQFRLNEALLLRRRDAGALHQARVALRRLRSAFSSFRHVVADEESERLKAELREIASLLGEGRNLDVYGARVLAREAERDPPPPGLAEYAAWVAGEREVAYDAIAARLESQAFRFFVVDLAGWIEAGDWLARDENAALRDGDAVAFARAELRRRRRKVRKGGRALKALDPDSRHRLRIAAKKLRYASEFFAELFPGKKQRRRHRKLIASLEDLQDGLGSLNDIQTGEALAEGLARRHASDADRARSAAGIYAAGLAAGRQDEFEPDLLEAAAASHARFAAAKAFWR